ncbi:MAG: hypothetical protein WC860_03730 [Candidatus Margulisiibacteriota bacterium]|jgi:DNA-binding beta-propeller fold protein YncE
MKKNLGVSFIFFVLIFLTSCSSVINKDALSSLPKGTILIIGAPYQGKSTIAVKDIAGNVTITSKELGLIASDAEKLGNNLYVLHSGDNTLKILDISTLNTSHDLFLGTGNNVYEVSLVDSKKAYVSNFLKGTVSKIDLTNDSTPVIGTIQLPTGDALLPFNLSNPTFSGPAAIFYEKNCDKIFVGLTNLDATYMPGGPGLIAVINGSTDVLETVVNSQFLNPQCIYYNDNFSDYLYISFAGSFFDSTDGAILAFDLKTQKFVHEIKNLESPMKIAIDKNGNGFFTDGGIGANLGRFNALNFTYDKKVVLQSSEISFSTSAWISDIYCDSNNNWYCSVVDNKNGYLCKIDYEGKVLELFKINSYPSKIIEI